MAKRRVRASAKVEPATKPAGRRPRPDIVHSSVYLPQMVHEALRQIAFKERSKIHDVIMEGIGLVLSKRGYSAAGGL